MSVAAPKLRAVKDLSGERFGRLVVVRRVGSHPGGGSLWLCACDCGASCDVVSRNLRRGATRSCGCLKQEKFCTPGSRTKHGHTSRDGGVSPTYTSWRSMRDRCTNPKDNRYYLYGIRVCDRWLHSFENFLADMGERPSGMTLDRYPDKNGNYEPGNVRWATPKQQAANRRTASECARVE
jgi:hypothetical protein